uniref:Uncharacterized protein n=1 Tax=Oryza nivara TaxID=4536 RepID=A0A0E0FTY2_ORYNI
MESDLTLLPPLSLLPPLLQRAAATGKVGARAHMKVAAAVAELKLTRVARVAGPTAPKLRALPPLAAACNERGQPTESELALARRWRQRWQRPKLTRVAGAAGQSSRRSGGHSWGNCGN